MGKRLILLLILVLLCISSVEGRRKARRSSRKNRRNRRHRAPRKRRQQRPKSDEVQDPTTLDVDPNPRHGLTLPIDSSMEVWKFGGSAVMTDRMARLTPASQDRAGWIFNRHPLESESFEIEIDLQVFSDGHFGGDGLGIWFLDPKMESGMNFDFRGPVFGMKSNFKGAGIIVDVYDNDVLRNNPSIFVLTNFEGQPRNWDVDKDYKTNQYSVTPSHTPGHEPQRKNSYYKAHSCVAELRNTGKTTKLMIKYVQNIIHVYVNIKEKMKARYKFCLAVSLPQDQTLQGKHLTLTAATGEVVDHHDVLRITTKYLGDSPEPFDDTLLPEMDHEYSTQHRFFQMNLLPLLLLFSTALILTGLGGALILLITKSAGVDEHMVIPNLNSLLRPYYATQALTLVVCCFSSSHLFIVANFLIFGIHCFKFKTNCAYFDQKSLREGTIQGLPLPIPHWDLYLSEVVYSAMLLARLVELFD